MNSVRREAAASFPFLLLACAVGGASVALLATRHAYLALVPAVSLLACFFLGRLSEVGFYFLVGYVPFQNYTALSSAGGYDFLTVQKFVGAWIILVLALSALLNKRFEFNLRSSLWFLFAGLTATGFVSLLLSEFPVVAADTMRALLNDFVYFGLSLVFLSRRAVYVRVIPAVIVASVTLSGLLSIIGYLFDLSAFSLNVESENIKRWRGGAYNPNYFSSIVTFSLPILMHWFLNTRRVLARLGIMLLAGVGASAIVLTYSRGGFLIFSASLLLLLVEYGSRLRPRHLGFFTIGMAAAIIVLAIATPRSFWERQLTTFSSAEIKTDISLSRRLSYLHVGWQEFRERPLLGAGPGTFNELYGRTAIAWSYTDNEAGLKRAAHNTYLHFLVGTGIVGLLIYVAILAVGYSGFIRAERRFRVAGDRIMLSLTKAYKVSYLTILISLFTINGQDHKYVWLALGFSQAALFLATRCGRAGENRSAEALAVTG